MNAPPMIPGISARVFTGPRPRETAKTASPMRITPGSAELKDGPRHAGDASPPPADEDEQRRQ